MVTLNSYEQIYAVVKQVPRGQVATYGQIAILADLPGHARQVGYALNNLPQTSDIPWHRVINAKGTISLRASLDGYENLQRLLLEREGVRFNIHGVVSLSQFQWRPKAKNLLTQRHRK